jgi:hypothetical protein
MLRIVFEVVVGVIRERQDLLRQRSVADPEVQGHMMGFRVASFRFS